MKSFMMYIKSRIQIMIFTILEKYLSKENQEKSNSFVFVNLSQLGDVVVSSLILENDDTLTSKNIYFIINSEYKNLFSGYNGKINIIGLNVNLYRWNIFYKIKMLRVLNALKIKNIYNLSPGRGYSNDEFCLIPNSINKYTITKDSYHCNVKIKNYFDKKYDFILFNEKRNEYEKHLMLLQLLTGKKEVSTKNIKTFTVISEKEKDYILISPFTSNELKDWGIDKYKLLCEKLSHNYKIVITGSQHSGKLLREIKNNNSKIIINIDSLDRIPSIIFNSCLYIGNDSGISHIAFRMNKKMLVILSGAFYGKFFPVYGYPNILFANKYMDCYNCKLNCLYKLPKCLNEISVEEVFKMVKKLI